MCPYYKEKTRSNHNLLQELLDKYPLFFSKTPKSVHYRYHNTLADVLNGLVHSRRILKYAQRLNRPIQIWYTFPPGDTVNIKVLMDNIKYVRLYNDKTSDNQIKNVLVYESEDLQGKHSHEYTYIIKKDEKDVFRWFLEVQTMDDLFFYKGIPENPILAPEEDWNKIYNPDLYLSRLGLFYGIPRLKYKDSRNIEGDYNYQKRIERYLNQLKVKSLPLIEIERLFGVKPNIKGFWRDIAVMDESLMDPINDVKYMADNDFNTFCHEISLNTEDLIEDIEIPSPEEVKYVLVTSSPIGTKPHFTLYTNRLYTSSMSIGDEINYSYNWKDKNYVHCTPYYNPVIPPQDPLIVNDDVHEDMDLDEKDIPSVNSSVYIKLPNKIIVLDFTRKETAIPNHIGWSKSVYGIKPYPYSKEWFLGIPAGYTGRDIDNNKYPIINLAQGDNLCVEHFFSHVKPPESQSHIVESLNNAKITELKLLGDVFLVPDVDVNINKNDIIGNLKLCLTKYPEKHVYEIDQEITLKKDEGYYVDNFAFIVIIDKLLSSLKVDSISFEDLINSKLFPLFLPIYI